jgi:hypothetical protein
MLFMDFIVWWYSRGWVLRFSSIGLQTAHWAQFFSLGTLLRTLFSPWHQIITPKGAEKPLGDIFRTWLDNGVSRFVGFWVRLIVFFSGLIMLALIILLNFSYAILWPFLPLLPLIVIIIGVL